MQEFLAQRRGYCEQFAGTFAAFARVLGLPSRVAVGFTPGELRDDGRYYVQDKHAHAWPEIYFDGLGWVPFEPTPARGNPAAVQYTGVARPHGCPSSTTVSKPAAHDARTMLMILAAERDDVIRIRADQPLERTYADLLAALDDPDR